MTHYTTPDKTPNTSSNEGALTVDDARVRELMNGRLERLPSYLSAADRVDLVRICEEVLRLRSASSSNAEQAREAREAKDAARYRYLRTELSAVQSFPSEFEISFMLRKIGKFFFNSEGLDAYLDALEVHDAAINAQLATEKQP